MVTKRKAVNYQLLTASDPPITPPSGHPVTKESPVLLELPPPAPLPSQQKPFPLLRRTTPCLSPSIPSPDIKTDALTLSRHSFKQSTKRSSVTSFQDVLSAGIQLGKQVIKKTVDRATDITSTPPTADSDSDKEQKEDSRYSTVCDSKDIAQCKQELKATLMEKRVGALVKKLSQEDLKVKDIPLEARYEQQVEIHQLKHTISRMETLLKALEKQIIDLGGVPVTHTTDSSINSTPLHHIQQQQETLVKEQEEWNQRMKIKHIEQQTLLTHIATLLSWKKEDCQEENPLIKEEQNIKDSEDPNPLLEVPQDTTTLIEETEMKTDENMKRVDSKMMQEETDQPQDTKEPCVVHQTLSETPLQSATEVSCLAPPDSCLDLVTPSIPLESTSLSDDLLSLLNNL